MDNIAENISKIKDKLPEVTPTPPDFHQQATAHELKSRLNLGEPALTILDVQNNEAFRHCHIVGAMNVSTEDVAEFAKSSLELNRDIYIYGANDEETAQAANALRQAGFSRVAELQGGLQAWGEIYGAMEGIDSEKPPSKGDYFDVARLQEFKDEKDKENQMKKNEG
ncbi:Rhodanese domain protein [Gloeothece citriformis PCC 7424]|uniref:Rhodanese domain protein n=1 Tax=Gloeothece citriformis (strain PCC 7424) TaxID=65393 RepID=B7KL60_GLOC7|nr:rhodanese-like domain-containing protein [Gloeothece citriformis]ACK72432.1 Rhodanese domain protein [Gloeothece citriformis PCC 7424]